MDRLQRSDFIDEMNGKIFLSQYEAWANLTAGAQQGAADTGQGDQLRCGA
jgi:SulP family sulfate permease